MGDWILGSKVTFLHEDEDEDEDEEALLSSVEVLGAQMLSFVPVYMMGPLANLIVWAGSAGFGGPDPMAPYLVVGRMMSMVLSSSRF